MPVLVTEGENAGAPVGMVGTLVSSLVDLDSAVGGLDNVTDPDAGALTGIALTATDTAHGSWFYSTDNGTTWNPVGAVSDSSARLLAADANTRLYFQPNTNYSGTDTGAITFRAWDQTNGSNGGVANTSVNGGTTAFSTATDTANITVAPVRIGSTFYATIGQALTAAQNGDTIFVSAGTYNENVIVNKSVTIQGVGAPGSVKIHGTFEDHNVANNVPANHMTPGEDVNEFLQNHGYDVAGVGDGITVSADNVTLSNLTVEDFDSAVKVTGPSVTGLTLEGMTLQHSVNGFLKPDDTALNGLTIDSSAISDTYIGVQFANDSSATGGAGFGKDATDTTITDTDFKDITVKGIYVETLQGTTLFDGITMDNVGQFGTGAGFAAPSGRGTSGNGIDLNLKYHTYTGDVTISNFTLTDTGASTGTTTGTPVPGQPASPVYPNGHAGGGAIVLEARDDATSYNTIPADASGLNITVENGTIDGTTSTAIRTGEPNKHNLGPAVDVDNVAVTGTVLQTEISNLTSSPMTVTGTAGDDTYRNVQTVGYSGQVLLYGLGGNDVLTGGGGDDVLQGGTGDDTLDGGGAGIDTADYSDALSDGLVVDLTNQALTGGTSTGGGLGNDTLFNINNLVGSAFSDTLIGDAGDNVLRGGAGDDTLDGGVGGTDTADYSDATSNGLVVDLTTSVSSGGGLGNDTVIDVQNITGSAFNDTLIGDGNDNVLSGGAGNDILYGHGGANSLIGGAGTDVAYYNGLETSYGIIDNDLGGGEHSYFITGGPDSVTGDGLNNTDVERLKFLAPSHVSDVNNDGAADLVFQNGSAIEVNGVVLNPVGGLNPALPASFNVVGTGQFNPDVNRNSDILVQDTSNGSLQVLMDINGATVGSSANLTGAALTPSNSGVAWKAIATGDFNGDASWDVVLQNQTTKAVEIFTIKPQATDAVGVVSSVNSVASPAGANWKVVAAGDFNADGKSDILWQNSASKAIAISLMNGATTTNTPTAMAATNLTAVATGDFNDDGYSDVLFKNNSGQAVLWFMLDGTHVGTQTISHPTQMGVTWSVSGAADVDGNGYSDILWTDQTAGVSSATLLDGPSNLVSTHVNNMGTPAASQGSNFHLIATGGG
jgi:Ca2+-binding RTX toxin-like protein